MCSCGEGLAVTFFFFFKYINMLHPFDLGVFLFDGMQQGQLQQHAGP